MIPTVAAECVSPITTDRLYIMYDTGETVPFLAEIAYQVRHGKDVRFIAFGSAVNSLTVANCDNNPELYEKIQACKIDLKKDLAINDEIDPIKWPREAKLSKDAIHKIRDKIVPKVVIVGTASRIQKQVLSHFPTAVKIAFADNIDYTTSNPTFATVEQVQKQADVVMCPSKHTVSLFKKEDGSSRRYVVVGLPTLETWTKQIQVFEKQKPAILQKLHFSSDKPVVALMDAYDSNSSLDDTYSAIISPLLQKLAAVLTNKGYQVVIQPHPKMRPQVVTTPELLAVSEYVIGYNSSTVFNSLALGKKCIYLIPERNNKKSFGHFSIDKGYAKAITFCDAEKVPDQLLELLETLKKEPAKDLFALEAIPRSSIEKIDEIMEAALQRVSFQAES